MTTKHPIDVSITIGRAPSEVWDYIRHIESHVDWMHDANAIRITSLTRSGVGTIFECDTKIGPFRLVDKMEITTWKENETMGVRHQGLVSGWGEFSLEPSGTNETIFRWAESLSFPFYLGSWVGEFLARPVLKWVWRRNLTQLKDQVEKEHHRK